MEYETGKLLEQVYEEIESIKKQLQEMRMELIKKKVLDLKKETDK